MSVAENALEAALVAKSETIDLLIWTGPTTVPGVVALLELWPLLKRARIDDDQADDILTSVCNVLRDLHPTSTVSA